jgi:two-component system chemotaxis response regulator CheV
MPRDEIISIVDLAEVMNLPHSNTTNTDMYIVTNFNQLNTAFHVHSVEGIHRVSWSDIVKPDSTINASGVGMATGIVRLDDKLIIILDFEKIVAEINPETGLKVSDVDNMVGRTRVDSPIMIAEDSPLLGKMLVDCLKRAGFVNIDVSSNGQECWDKLVKFQKDGVLDKKVSCVITDIEMPQMDGHHLTKLIKSDEEMEHVPVIIFSSLINEEMRRKGESLGANKQLSKPEIGQLVGAIDEVLNISHDEEE